MTIFTLLKELDYRYSENLSRIIPINHPKRVWIRIFTHSGIQPIWAAIPVVLIFFFPEYSSELLSYFLFVMVMLGVVQFLKRSIKRSRPSWSDLSGGVTKFDRYSFPSGHATRAISNLVFFTILFPQTLWLWIIWGTLISLSRIVLGVHYISDILGGYVLTLIFVYIWILLGWFPGLPIESLA